MCNSYVTDSCTRPEIFWVSQFNGVLEIYSRPTAVGMVMKILRIFDAEFSYNLVCVRDMCQILAPNQDFQRGVNFTACTRQSC